MTSRRSSGSSRDDNSVDPTRSLKRTVSWRRSAVAPSSSGAGGTVAIDCATPPDSTARNPHFALQSAQKVALERLRYPQAGQATGAGAPHSMQNLARSGRLARQIRHCICLASQFETSFPEATQSSNERNFIRVPSESVCSALGAASGAGGGRFFWPHRKLPPYHHHHRRRQQYEDSLRSEPYRHPQIPP